MSLSEPAKALLLELADGQFHSGEALGKRFGTSRASIWGLIHELEDLGLEIHSVRGKGYRLAHPVELLDGSQIQAALSPESRALLATLELHDTLDSTNSRLLHLPEAAKVSGYACLAEFQTAGRGRIGRSWQSPLGGNICLSLLWRFQEQSRIAGLSLAVGVAVARALVGIGVAEVGLKWPNDILWRGRKLGGILLEVSGEANGIYNVVIGIGINVAVSARHGAVIDQPWVDLREIAGLPSPPRNELVGRLLDELLAILAGYEQEGLVTYIDEWRHFHSQQGMAVQLLQGDRVVRGVLADVSDDGMLLLEIEGGERRAYASGDLSLRISDG